MDNLQQPSLTSAYLTSFTQWIPNPCDNFNIYLYTLTSFAGISAHQFLFKHGEWHMKAPLLVRLYIAVTFLTTIFAISPQGTQVGIRRTTFANITFLVSLFSSIGIYRVFFHRLRRFPGPFLARVSKLWHVWKCVKSRSQNHIVLDELHKQYGDFVRTGEFGLTLTMNYFPPLT